MASALAQLVTEVVCNPAFARWLFASPADALDALRYDATRALGPGLPGPEFAVPSIALSDEERHAVISFGAQSASELADAILAWQRDRHLKAARPARETLLAAAS